MIARLRPGLARLRARVQQVVRRALLALDHPWAVMCLVAIAYALFVGARVRLLHGDVTAFITAGSDLTDASRTPVAVKVIQGPGYDGQFYYALAHAPFIDIRTVAGVNIDDPAYRQQRLLYPLIVWLVTGGGRPALVPWAMVLVNCAALAWMGWTGAVLAHLQRRHALIGITFALYPGFILVLSRNLTEILECALLLAALLALERERPWRATGLLCLATLAKETALFAAFGVGVCWAITVVNRRRGPKWHTAILPLATYVTWQMWLYHIWGRLSWTRRGLRLTAAMPTRLAAHTAWLLEELPAFWRTVYLVEFAATGVLLAVVIVAIWRSRASPAVKVAWAVYLLLATTLRHFLGGDWAFLRALGELYLLSAWIAVARGRLWAWGLSASMVSAWLALAANVLSYR